MLLCTVILGSVAFLVSLPFAFPAKLLCTPRQALPVMSRDHTQKPKKTNVRVSGTYGDMFTIPLAFHVLAHVPQCTSSIHLLFGAYGGVIIMFLMFAFCFIVFHHVLDVCIAFDSLS